MKNLSRLALFTLFAAGACAPGADAGEDRAPAEVALLTAGEHYADLEGTTDSLLAFTEADNGAPSEAAQAVARELARRLGEMDGEFEEVTLAMTAAQLERVRSPWMRLAMSTAAMKLLREDAARLAHDPATSPAEVYDLADQLSASLELATSSSRLAASEVVPPTPQ